MSDRRERLNSPEESALTAMEGLQAKIWTALPGYVVSVDLGAQTVTVQPTIKGITSDASNNDTAVNLPVLPDVPICWPRGGGFALTFPVKAGDEVLVVFASRAIDAWWQSGGVGAPVEARMHDLSDGFAILAPTSQPKRLGSVSSTAVQLRNEAGTTSVAINADGTAEVIAPTVRLRNTAGTASFTLNADGSAAIVATTLTHNGVNIGGTHVHPENDNAPLPTNGPQ